MFENLLRVSTSSRVLVLCAVVLAQKFLATELSSPFIVLLGLLVMFFGKIQRGYLKLVWPLLGVLVIGLMGMGVFGLGYESRHILRDIAFALTPIALIFIGWWIAGNRGMWPLILKVMVILGFVLALTHLSFFVLNPALLSAKAMDVRSVAGMSGDLVSLALVIGLFFQKRFGINDLFPRLLPRLIVMPVLLASFVLSYSRTEFVVVLILSLALLGVLTKVNSRMILAIAVLVIGFFALALTTPKDEVGTFRSKLVRSVTEIAVSDYHNMSDINFHWRGFESYRVWATFLSGNLSQQIFGQGFGALVDLGFVMPLGGNKFRYIPVFHNGYAYILIKTGLIGLACYVFFYISVIRYSVRYCQTTNGEQEILARLLLGCVLSLIAIMYVVGGMAETRSSELVLLLGYLVRRMRQFQTEKSRIEVVRSKLGYHSVHF
jgi:hypothetical protein